jgi:hypothetical protein
MSAQYRADQTCTAYSNKRRGGGGSLEAICERGSRISAGETVSMSAVIRKAFFNLLPDTLKSKVGSCT